MRLRGARRMGVAAGGALAAMAAATVAVTLASIRDAAQTPSIERAPLSGANAVVDVAPAAPDAVSGAPNRQMAGDGLTGLPPLDALPVAEPAPPQLTARPPALSGKAIVVDQSLQMMAVFEDGVEIRRMPVSTGRPTYTTYTLPWNGYVGRYVDTFQSRTGGRADNAWYLYEATGSILIHGAPYYLVDGEKQYYELDALGSYPASDGCIRLDPDDAQWLTAWGPQNVPIRVTELPGEIAGLVTSG